MEKICVERISSEETVNIPLAKFEQLVEEATVLKTAFKLLPFVPSYEQENALSVLFGKPAEEPMSDELSDENDNQEATPDA